MHSSFHKPYAATVSAPIGTTWHHVNHIDRAPSDDICSFSENTGKSEPTINAYKRLLSARTTNANKSEKQKIENPPIKRDIRLVISALCERCKD